MLGPCWGQLGAILGPSSATLGLLGAKVQSKSKHTDFLLVFNDFESHLGAIWGNIVAILGHLGAILRLSAGQLGQSWGHLGAMMGHLGAIFGHFGASWGQGSGQEQKC